MTWKDFKDAVEALNVKDDDELWFIDWHSGDKVRLYDRCTEDMGTAIV